MPHQNYLYRQRNNFHFRRRIPGLSTFIRPVQVALGTTDQKTAHSWLRTLMTEFDAMLNAFTFLLDPLPEELIISYFRARIQQVVNDLRREQRMERMSGRKKVPHATHRVERAVLNALIQDGIDQALPPAWIDSSWSPDEVEGAVTLYAREVRGLRASEPRRRIMNDFEATTGVKLASREHECQIIEAHLYARLTALDMERKNQQLRVEAYADLAKAFLTQSETASTPTVSNGLPSPSSAPNSAGSVNSEVLAKTPAPLPAQQPVLLEPTTSDNPKVDFTAGVTEIREPLTINALRTQQAQAEAVARGHEKVADGPDIASVYWRMAISDGYSKETCAQRANGVRLFCFITGVQRVDEIRQHHLSSFRDSFTAFPTHFMKSPGDGEKTIEEIMHKARFLPGDEKGLHITTRRRHIKSMDLLLERAASEGHLIDTGLDVKKVKPKARGKGAKHKQRSAFAEDELKKVFAHSLWQGAKSEGNRHEPGSVIARDSRYWIPLILAYTGARRAEIAGLRPSDIQEIEGHHCIVIQANEYRSIKGEEPGETDERCKKTRIVPIHPHLIELGLCEHASNMKDRGKKLLFPDVVPKPRKGSRRAAAHDPALMVDKFGQAIDYMWRTSLEAALNGNPRKLCMHSMRHYVNDFFLFSKVVLGAVRYDLLGHVKSESEDTNTSVYRGESPLKLKAAAINKLPRLF